MGEWEEQHLVYKHGLHCLSVPIACLWVPTSMWGTIRKNRSKIFLWVRHRGENENKVENSEFMNPVDSHAITITVKTFI